MNLKVNEKLKIGKRTVVVNELTPWADATYIQFLYRDWPVVVSTDSNGVVRPSKTNPATNIKKYLVLELDKIDALIAGGLKPVPKSKAEQVEVGMVGVDSGQILIVDPAYLHPPAKNRAGGWVPEKHYEECGDATMGRGAGQLESMSAVASSTDGDGQFPVIATMKHGRVLKLEIEFMSEKDADQAAAHEMLLVAARKTEEKQSVAATK